MVILLKHFPGKWRLFGVTVVIVCFGAFYWAVVAKRHERVGYMADSSRMKTPEDVRMWTAGSSVVAFASSNCGCRFCPGPIRDRPNKRVLRKFYSNFKIYQNYELTR